MKVPVLFTMGDPAGIGPEICLKAAASRRVRDLCLPVILGDAAWLERTQRTLKSHPARRFRLINSGNPDSLVIPDRIPPRSILVVDFHNVPARRVQWGKISAHAGRASGEYIWAATNWVMEGKAAGLVTAPIHKVAFRLGGWGKRFIGHTEMLGALTGSRHVDMMLVHGRLRAVHVTSHVPLCRVPDVITRARVSTAIDLAYDGVKALGIRKPRIAVCGLNPHAGDGGLLGSEETRIILPAIRSARRKGRSVFGPLAADMAWPLVLSGHYDVGVAMYHDQGQIPVKLLAFRRTPFGNVSGGVNVTLGLPIVRTSAAHGTAFDIAGRGIASEGSMVEATRLACQLVDNR